MTFFKGRACSLWKILMCQLRVSREDSTNSGQLFLYALILSWQPCYDMQVEPNLVFLDRILNFFFLFSFLPAVMLPQFPLIYNTVFSDCLQKREILATHLTSKGVYWFENLDKTTPDNDKISLHHVRSHQRSIPNVHTFVIHGSQKLPNQL